MSDVIFDKQLELFASGTIDSNGNGTGKLVGPTPVIKGVVIVTAKSGTSPTLDIHFEESDNDSSYDDIPGAAVPQFVNEIGKKEVYFRATKKYVRHAQAVGGTSPSFIAQILLTSAEK